MQGNQGYDQRGNGRHVGPLLEAFHAGMLRAMEAEQVERHLRACAACREQSDAIALYRLIRAAPAPAVGPELRERVYARIAAESAPVTPARVMGQVALRERQGQPRAVVPAHAHGASPSRGWLSGAVAVVIVALLASVFWALPRLRGGAVHGSATPAPITRACPPGSAATLPANGYINAIALTSANEGWAVGSIVTPQATLPHVLLLQLNGCHLTPYTLDLPGVELSDISMGSPTDGWVIGNAYTDTTNTPVLLHYSAGAWKRVALPQQAPTEGAFDAVRMLNANEGWIIMHGAKDSHGLLRYGLLHDVNGVWSPVSCPLPVLLDVAPVGPNDAWVTGTDSMTSDAASTYRFAHYHDGQWTVMPQPTGAGLGDLRAISPTDIWASGVSGAFTSSEHPVVAHYDGEHWQVAPQAVPSGAGAYDQLFALGDGSGWAFHTTVTKSTWLTPPEPNTGLVTAVSRETGGQWQTIDWPYKDVVLIRAFAPGSAGDAWVVGTVGKYETWRVPNSNGGYSGGGGFVGHSVLLHYANGAWTRYG